MIHISDLSEIVTEGKHTNNPYDWFFVNCQGKYMALHNLTSLWYTYFPSMRPFFKIVKKKRAYDITYHWVLYLSMWTVRIVVWKDLRETKDRWQWKLKCIQELSKTWTKVVGMWVSIICACFLLLLLSSILTTMQQNVFLDKIEVL